MSFAARYPLARFGATLLENVRTILLATETEALAWSNRDANNVPQPGMAAYKFHGRARRVNSLFPAICTVLRRSNIVESADGAALQQDHVIEVVIEDLGEDPDQIAASVEKRAAAADMAVRSATGAQLYAGYAANKLKKPYFEITPHDFNDFFIPGSLYKRTGIVTLNFYNLWETL
jgi:hypothetical protein